MFEAGGVEVRPAGFCRDLEVATPLATRGALSLGQSHDAALAQRAFATFKHTAVPGLLKAHFANCDVLVARNLEQLAIVARIAGGRPIVYECLDIHRALLGSSPPAKMVQAVEAYLLPKCDLLITSSPAFLRNHFDHRPLKAEAILIENKLLLDPIEANLPVADGRPSDRPVTIGWFGMLRCKRTLSFLTDLARKSEGRIEVLIAGKPSPAELPHLESAVAAESGMTFTGPYAYSDLAELYGQCDFAWSIDWFEEGLNSKWLLPNRLYEALAFGSIPIALADVEVGNWLRQHDAGLVVESADSAAQALLAMTDERLREMRSNVTAVDATATICRQSECDALAGKLRGLLN